MKLKVFSALRLGQARRRRTKLMTLIAQLKQLRERAYASERHWSTFIEAASPERRASAVNLAHYLALRQADLRKLQVQLGSLGLSRLGRSEANTMASLNAVLTALLALAGRRAPTLEPPTVGIEQGIESLSLHAAELLGPACKTRRARIMVTMPSEAAHRPELIRDLLLAGMNVMRINCAHDHIDDWRAMIEHLRAAERECGLPCRIYADLAGPKLRTGALPAIGRVLDFKPTRDAFGHVTRPASICLTAGGNSGVRPGTSTVVVPVGEAVLAAARPGDTLWLEDCRGGMREVLLVSRSEGKWHAQGRRHTYLRTGAACELRRGTEVLARGTVGELPEVVAPLVLHTSDRLWLTRDDGDSVASGAVERNAEGPGHAEPSISCTLDAVFLSAKPGEPIWFNDGKFGGVICSVAPDKILVEITHAPERGARLRAEKGINLPETNLDIPSLSEKDLNDLRALAPHVDMVGLSFVRTASDVRDLSRALAELDASHLGRIFKIETRRGFENLASILMASHGCPPTGVMVARGDLAVEVGFERLAEVEEEILWLCEAAHVPVIWATQVLENMAKQGLPSRAEVSDAAYGVRSECVMLNKGPCIVPTVQFLSNVLERMSAHQAKRKPMMRRLSVAQVVVTG